MKRLSLVVALLFSPLAALLADEMVLYWTGLYNRWGGGEHNSFSKSPKGADFERVRSGDTVHMVFHTNALQGQRMKVGMNRERVTIQSLNFAAPRGKGFTLTGSAERGQELALIGPVNVVGGDHLLEDEGGAELRLRNDLRIHVAADARLHNKIPFTGSSGLLKTGAGALITDDAVHGYTGLTLIREGVFGGNATLSGDLFLESGAMLRLNPAKALTVNGTTSFRGFGIDAIDGLSRDTGNGVHTLIIGRINPANISNLGAAAAHSFGRNKYAHLEADESGLRLIVETRGRR